MGSESKIKIKDIKSMDDFDFEKIEMIRGETPQDIRETCFQLSKDYLGGVWLQLSIEDIVVNRISGGFTNQLYYCAVSKQHKAIGDEPVEVAIRLYGGKHFNNLDCAGNERLTDVIIGLLVSEYKLGPKIYGLFEKGQIQAYYKHKQFRVEEQNDPKLVEELSAKLARVHSMNVPIKRSSNWALDSYDLYYEEAYKKFDINELMKKLNLKTLLKHDLKQELQWLKKTMIESNSPIVFGHNDFRGSNILVIDSDNNNIEKDERIVLCDYEYSSYTFRGVDFGTIFYEWGRDLNGYRNLHNFPKDSVITKFIDGYISESVKINGKEYAINNTVEQILKEVKIFTLFGALFFVIFCLKNDPSVDDLSFDKELSMQFAEKSYEDYCNLKEKFILEGIVDDK